MSELISSVIQKQLGGDQMAAGKQQLQQSQNNRSFENVLQQQDGQKITGGENQINQVDPNLESRRAELAQRLQQLPEGMPKVAAVMPEFLGAKTNMNNFREIFNKAASSVGSMPGGKDVQGKFAYIENEWKDMESIMKSDKDMSQGELLGLQARLYQVSQHIDVLSKVVDQMSSGVKTILNTNV